MLKSVNLTTFNHSEKQNDKAMDIQGLKNAISRANNELDGIDPAHYPAEWGAKYNSIVSMERRLERLMQAQGR